jgi:hypothetical protein
MFAILPADISQTLAWKGEDYYGDFGIWGKWEYEGVSTFGRWGLSFGK